MLMQPQSDAETLHKHDSRKSKASPRSKIVPFVRKARWAVICGIGIELLIAVLVIWILRLGINQAISLIPFIAAIIAIISTPVVVLLAYVQWRHSITSVRPEMPSLSPEQLSLSLSSDADDSSTGPSSLSYEYQTAAQTEGSMSNQVSVNDQFTDTRPLLLISYNDANSPMAEWIHDQLLQEGYNTILGADYVPGSNPTLVMDEALKQAQHTLVLISPAYLKKNQAEWVNVFRTDPTGRALSLIPIYVQHSEKELSKGFLGGIMPIDLVGKKKEEARQILLHEIARSVDGKHTRPESPPPFPGEK